MTIIMLTDAEKKELRKKYGMPLGENELRQYQEGRPFGGLFTKKEQKRLRQQVKTEHEFNKETKQVRTRQAKSKSVS